MASTPPTPAGPSKAQRRAFNDRQSRYGPNALSKQMLEEKVPIFVNYDYANWRDVWRSIRHAMIGEIEIKRHGEFYLPRPSGMDEQAFHAYKDRAVFYNMVYRTVAGLTGAVFRREPRILNAGPKLTKMLTRISKDGLSMTLLAKVAAQDVLATGRYGVLADKAPDSAGPLAPPYLASYTAENILDWTTSEIDGLTEVDFVILREFKTDRNLQVVERGSLIQNVNYGRFYCVYRILRLTYNDEDSRWEYHQELYQRDNADADLTEIPTISIPLVFGVPMTRLPFKFFNATTNLPDVEKPPILDILTLNLAHFKQYAQLQHARWFTANPVYVVSGAKDDDEYHIGPSVVWEIGKGETASVLEYQGRGLDSLEKGLDVLEAQAASIGGRMVGDSPNAGMSNNQIKLKDRNEQSLLLNITTVINENFTYLLGVIADWLNESSDNLAFRVNQDFLLDGTDAREFRAITMMYQEGILPIDMIYEYFLKSEIIPEYVTLEVFKKLVEDTEQFPNQADVDAMAEGYHNATDRMLDRQFKEGQTFEGEQAIVQQDHEAKLQEDQNSADADAAKEEQKTAVKVAKVTPKVLPAVPAAAAAANTVDPNNSVKPAAAPKPTVKKLPSQVKKPAA